MSIWDAIKRFFGFGRKPRDVVPGDDVSLQPLYIRSETSFSGGGEAPSEPAPAREPPPSRAEPPALQEPVPAAPPTAGGGMDYSGDSWVEDKSGEIVIESDDRLRSDEKYVQEVLSRYKGRYGEYVPDPGESLAWDEDQENEADPAGSAQMTLDFGEAPDR